MGIFPTPVSIINMGVGWPRDPAKIFIFHFGSLTSLEMGIRLSLYHTAPISYFDLLRNRSNHCYCSYITMVDGGGSEG